MPRKATGQVIVPHVGKNGRMHPRFALRFRAYGARQYVTLGSPEEGWDLQRAQEELDNVLADVRRGIWRPAQPEVVPGPNRDPTFSEFAGEWLAEREDGWRAKTRVDYRWQLFDHLLPFFQHRALSQITPAEVDRYKAEKVRESKARAEALERWRRRAEEAATARERRELGKAPPRPLSANTINRTLVTLAQILELAVEYDLIPRNPAKGKRRRLKSSRPTAVWLDTPQRIAALLHAAGELDKEAPLHRRHVERQAMLSVFVFSGLRIAELCELRWRDVDLSGGRLTVRESKTDAGVRTIDIFPVLHDALTGIKAKRNPASTELVFPTTEGKAHSQSNIRQRVLGPAVKRANERLEEAGEAPLPDGLTPHKLRHTYASLLAILGESPVEAMHQLGHTDAKFTAGVYQHSMRRDPATKQAFRDLVGLTDQRVDWAALGSRPGTEPARRTSEAA